MATASRSRCCNNNDIVSACGVWKVEMDAKKADDWLTAANGY